MRPALNKRQPTAPGWERKALTKPRFGNSAIAAGAGAWWALNGLRAFMLNLQSNPLKELAFTDLTSMVGPRTAMEGHKRGAVRARETFLRELVGTLTNTFLAGWLGAATAFGLRWFVNPQHIDHRAFWINTKSLEEFGRKTEQVLARSKGKSAAHIQREVLREILRSVQSDDDIARRPDLKPYFTSRQQQGFLEDAHIEDLVKRFMTKTPYHTLDLGADVKRMQQWPQHQEALKRAVEDAERTFRQKFGNVPLSKAQVQALVDVRTRTYFKALATQRVRLRQIAIDNSSHHEGAFIQHLYNDAWKTGKLTERAFLLNAKGERVTHRALQDLLAETRRYAVLLTETLQKTDAFHKANVNASDMARIERMLFQPGGRNALQQKLIPTLRDGLVPYLYKSKYFIVYLPLILATIAGCSMVVINNWITRRQFGGEEFFPGERVFETARGDAR